MDESNLVEGVAKVAAGGVGAGGGLYFVRWLILWVGGVTERRAAANDVQRAELDQSWKGYRLTLQARLEKSDERTDRLEREVEDCHASKRETDPR